jgi:hypothetical protein
MMLARYVLKYNAIIPSRIIEFLNNSDIILIFNKGFFIMMSKKEQEALFRSILDDSEMFTDGPEKDFDDLIEEFTKAYIKAGNLVKKYHRYYNFSKNLQETNENDQNIDNTMSQLETSIQILANFINSLYTSISTQITMKNNSGVPISWSTNLNPDGTTKKQRFINALQIAKNEIDRMQNISNSINTLVQSKDQLINILDLNGLLTEEELKSLL